MKKYEWNDNYSWAQRAEQAVFEEYTGNLTKFPKETAGFTLTVSQELGTSAANIHFVFGLVNSLIAKSLK